MTENQTEQTKEAVDAAVQPGKLARVIEDPFASALMATAVTATAVGFVLTGMFIVQVAIS